MSEFANSLTEEEYGEVAGFPASDCSMVFRDLVNVLELEIKHWKSTKSGKPNLKNAVKELFDFMNDEDFHAPRNGALVKMPGREFRLRFCENCGTSLKSNDQALTPSENQKGNDNE
jgi:hypothetical protein